MFVMSPRRVAFHLATVLVVSAPAIVQAQNSNAGWDAQQILRTESFVKPPDNLVRMITTPRVDISFTNASPDRRWFLRASGSDRGDIKAYGAPHIWLGGVQVDTRANRARSLTTSNRTGLTLVDPKTGTAHAISVPAGASMSSPVWSPRGTQVAYIANFPTGSYAYLADVANGKSVPLSRRALLATLVTTIEFTADGRFIVAVLVPENRGSVPEHGAGGIEDGPQVRLTDARAVPQPVHFSLLQDPHDKALLTFYTKGQLALIDVNSKAVRTIGAPATIREIDVAPDGALVRVTRMTEPYSYLVPASSFGSVDELWDASGRVITTLATTALREGAPADNGDPTATPAAAGAARRGPGADSAKRNIQWNPIGTGLLYVQTGKVVQWRAPFGVNDTTVVHRGSTQLSTVLYSSDSSTMFVTDSGSTIAIRVKDTSKRYNLGRTVSLPAAIARVGGGGGAGRSAVDSTQGTVLLRTGAGGRRYVLLANDGKSIAISGTRAYGAKWSTQAPRPWVDKLDIESKTRTRVMDSPANMYEEFVAPLDDDLSQFIVTRESNTTIADAWLRTAGSNDAKKLTKNLDVAPEVTGAPFKRLEVTRPRDGTKFWVEVTVPRDWKPGTKLPGVIWFYPREFSSEQDYERSRYSTNINKFPEVPSARPATATKLWVSQGYAFIEPDIPIFGDVGKMNDNYTRDLKENLDAVLDAVVEAGFVDRDKMGIGGHSYGAFSTVNALTLMPNFKAGIAGDGMYNRTLTPFGFQGERRNFYQAQDTYLDMSPFLRADKISGALLMYHAIEDQNQGTDPISSRRMFMALQGLGKQAALYMYPYEDHSVATYASDLDLWARWVAWMDTYVKNPKPTQAKAALVP
ncbi:S9 family peptidase [Gemmatimonas sp.]|uniref:S9 family peptidase n=1 Tax=Gemmatimonas sp. TaxID=1962908 RepID=UPI003983A9CB